MNYILTNNGNIYSQRRLRNVSSVHRRTSHEILHRQSPARAHSQVSPRKGAWMPSLEWSYCEKKWRLFIVSIRPRHFRNSSGGLVYCKIFCTEILSTDVFFDISSKPTRWLFTSHATHPQHTCNPSFLSEPQYRTRTSVLGLEVLDKTKKRFQRFRITTISVS